jgi:hypothetical protein
VIRPPGAHAEAVEDHDYAPAIYGAILVTGIVAVQWRHDPDTDAIALTVLISVVVFWLAHVWSEIVNLRVHGTISSVDIRDVVRNEGSMLSALVLPAVVLAVLPRVGVSLEAAVVVALGVCIIQLFLWGLVVGRAAHRGWFLPLVVAVVDSLLGLVLVALKVAVLH